MERWVGVGVNVLGAAGLCYVTPEKSGLAVSSGITAFVLTMNLVMACPNWK